MSKRKNKTQKGCEYCGNCIPLGEGDHICYECGEPKIVICEYEATEDYMCCNGKYFEE